MRPLRPPRPLGPMRQPWTVRTAALLGGCLLLVGCSDDEPAPRTDEERAADNLAAQIKNSGDVAGDGSVTEEQASCIGTGTVDEVGVDALQEYGILTDDLKVDRSVQGVTMDEADADALAGVFVDCLDTEALFERQFLQQAGDVPARQERCVREVVDADAVREVLSLSFQGKSADAVYADLQDALGTCAPRGRDPRSQ